MKYKGLATVVTAMSVFGGAVVATSDTYATGVADQINVTIPVACSLTSIVDSAHTTTVENSAYEDEVGETTFKVFCNDAEGFSVYAVGYTDDTFGNNTLKPSTVSSSTYSIATGTATSGDTSNWAMKLTAVTGTYAPTIHSTEENSNTYSFTSYHTIPSEYTKVASYSSNTDATTGSSFKSTYAVYASPTQPADSYTGKVKYTIVHPASEAAPIETISQLTYMQDFKDLTTEQRTAVLNSMEYNTTYNLIDNRDNKTYQIARLKDDNIWMAENLDLGRTTLTTDLTSANTNLDTNTTTITASTFNSWVKTSGTQSYTSAELIPLTTSNTSNSLDTDATSSTPYGTLYNYCAASAGTICPASGGNNDDATSDLCPAGWRLPTGGSSGEFQSLYNLTDYNTNAKMRAPITNGGAAFALAGYFSNSTPADQGSYGYYWSSTRNSGSIMYGLYLTTSSVSLDIVNYRYMGNAVRCVAKKPHSLTISYGAGVSNIQVNGVTIPDGGTVEMEEGFQYSITMTPSAGYGLDSWSVQSGVIDSASSQVITYTVGSSDTTLTANASYVATEMQNLSSSYCTTTASQARDNRDNHVYTIQRLADGKCWMMENLDLGRTELTTDLTSSNTNLTNTVTASTFNGWKKTSGSATHTEGEFIPVEGIDSTSRTPYGTLYNYCATSAGTICVSSYSNNATSDLCPAGWRLPTGDTTGEFQALYTEYHSNALMRAPIASAGAAFVLAGNFSSSTPTSPGSSGYYWSSTVYGILYMYSLNFGTSSVTPANIHNRYYGFAIRCVADI